VSERNENRPGYKKTKVGWIPEEWNATQLGSWFDLSSGITKPENTVLDFSQRSPFPVYGGNGILGYCSNSPLGGDALVIGRVGEKCGCVHLASGKYWITDNALYTSKWHREADYQFFGYLLQYLQLNRLRNKGGQPLVSQSAIKAKQAATPPLPEQKKIAEILSTWDEAIDQMRRLIDAKKRRKKALMQQLLSGEIRLSRFGKSKKKHLRFPGDWQRLRARELFEVRSVKKQNHEPVLSVTQDLGVVPRDTVERKIAFSEANTQACKLVEPGDFVISLRSFQGGIEASSYRGIVSPAYHVIRPTRKVDNTFYRYYFKCHDFIGHLVVAVIGIRDGKQVSYNDFAFMYLPYPSTEEQRAIGRILAAIDEDLKVCRRKLTALEKQKRGLMQKLLTGEVRVKVDDPKKKKPRTTRNTRTK
jgi:type I restriction enzyme, S subunit